MLVQIRYPEKLIYPDSDGQPMGENTQQVKWIVTLLNGFEALLSDNRKAFVAADLFWYPVEGDPTTVTAPDVMIAFGRPKGDRSSYMQWKEKNVAPQVVFEILSPGNRAEEMDKKFEFYREYGVEEYYIYQPEKHKLEISLRSGDRLVSVPQTDGFVSPRLKVRFEVSGTAPMRVIQPDGEAFLTYLELVKLRQSAQEQAQRDRRKAAEERRKAAAFEQAKDRLAAKLRELGIDPDTV